MGFGDARWHLGFKGVITAGRLSLSSVVARMARLAAFLFLGLVIACGCSWLILGGRWWVAEKLVRIVDSDSNRKGYETVVRPATDWVRQFRQRHDRLPTDAGIGAYSQTNWPGVWVSIYDSPPKWQKSWGQLGVDFMVCVQIGEWNLYRQFWDGKEWKVWIE